MNDNLTPLQREYEKALRQLEHVRLHDSSAMVAALTRLNEAARRLELAQSREHSRAPVVREALTG